MQVVESYFDDPVDLIRNKIKQGWKVVAMTSYPYNVYNYGSTYQCTTIVVYEKAE
jgi:hypothetical protein